MQKYFRAILARNEVQLATAKHLQACHISKGKILNTELCR